RDIAPGRITLPPVARYLGRSYRSCLPLRRLRNRCRRETCPKEAGYARAVLPRSVYVPEYRNGDPGAPANRRLGRRKVRMRSVVRIALCGRSGWAGGVLQFFLIAKEARAEIEWPPAHWRRSVQPSLLVSWLHAHVRGICAA